MLTWDYWGPSSPPRFYDCKSIFQERISKTCQFLFYKMEMYRDELYRLDVSEHIQFIEYFHIYKCLHGLSPKAKNLCRSVGVIEGQQLRSAARGQLDVTHLKTSTYGRRAFSFARPSAWNSLPNYLKDSRYTLVMCKRSIKTFLFFKVLAHRVHQRCLHVSVLYKFTFELL